MAPSTARSVDGGISPIIEAEARDDPKRWGLHTFHCKFLVGRIP